MPTNDNEVMITSDTNEMMSTTPRQFMTGAIPSPPAKLLAATPFLLTKAPPPQVAYVPKQLSVWGNNRYGDCVTAEEAFAKATYLPEIFISDQTVINWAERHGVLNGATLTEVLDAFSNGDGFVVGNQRYNDGPYRGVDYSNEMTLQGALSEGPVKIAIASGSLPRSAGQMQGWFALGGSRNRNTDHCVALTGYGPAEWLYQQLNVTLPSQLAGKFGYLLFTWGTIGFVDHKWLLATCVEAWVRNPTTVGVPPLQPPTPVPPVPPVPPSPPVPPVPPVPPTPGLWDKVERVLIQLSADGVKPRKILASLPKIILLCRQDNPVLTVEDIVAIIENKRPFKSQKLTAPKIEQTFADFLSNLI